MIENNKRVYENNTIKRKEEGDTGVCIAGAGPDTGLSADAGMCQAAGGQQRGRVRKLERFTTKEDGAVHEPERIFYGITRYVVEIAEQQGTQGYGDFIGRFGYTDEGREAVMSEFKVRAATSDSKKDATLEQLKPFGIGAMETTFRIVKADGKALVLESDYAKLELKRY